MPKETPIKRDLPGLCKLHMYDVGLYFSVIMLQSVMPSVDVKTAILQFMKTWEISEEEWSFTTAEQLFYRYSNSELLKGKEIKMPKIQTKYNRKNG